MSRERSVRLLDEPQAGLSPLIETDAHQRGFALEEPGHGQSFLMYAACKRLRRAHRFRQRELGQAGRVLIFAPVEMTRCTARSIVRRRRCGRPEIERAAREGRRASPVAHREWDL